MRKYFIIADGRVFEEHTDLNKAVTRQKDISGFFETVWIENAGNRRQTKGTVIYRNGVINVAL